MDSYDQNMAQIGGEIAQFSPKDVENFGKYNAILSNIIIEINMADRIRRQKDIVFTPSEFEQVSKHLIKSQILSTSNVFVPLGRVITIFQKICAIGESFSFLLSVSSNCLY